MFVVMVLFVIVGWVVAAEVIEAAPAPIARGFVLLIAAARAFAPKASARARPWAINDLT